MLESSDDESPFRSSYKSSVNVSRSISQVLPTPPVESNFMSPSEYIDRMLEGADVPGSERTTPTGDHHRQATSSSPPRPPRGGMPLSRLPSVQELDQANLHGTRGSVGFHSSLSRPPTPLTARSPLVASGAAGRQRGGSEGPSDVSGDRVRSRRTSHPEDLDSMMAVEVVPRVLSFDGLSGLHKTLQGMVKAMMSLRRDIVHTQQQMQSAEVNVRVAKLEGKLESVTSSLAQHPSEGGRFVTTDYLMDMKDSHRNQIEALKGVQMNMGTQQASSSAMLKERMDNLASLQGPVPAWIEKQLSDSLRGVNQQVDKLADENRGLRSELAEQKRQLEEVRDLQVTANVALQSHSNQQHLRDEVVSLRESLHTLEERLADGERVQTDLRNQLSRNEYNMKEREEDDLEFRDAMAADARSRAKSHEKLMLEFQADLDDTVRQLTDLEQRTNNHSNDLRLMGTHIDRSEGTSRERLATQISRVEERLTTTVDTFTLNDEKTKDRLADLSQWRIMADVRLGGVKEQFLAVGNEIADVKSELSAVLTAQGRVEMHAKTINDAGVEREQIREQIVAIVSAQQQLPELIDASLEEMEGSIRQYVKSKTDASGAASQQHVEARLAAIGEGMCSLLSIFGFDVGNTRDLFGDACRGLITAGSSDSSTLLISNSPRKHSTVVRPGYATATMEAWLKKTLHAIVSLSSTEDNNSEMSQLKEYLIYLLSSPSVQKDFGECSANELASRRRIEALQGSEWDATIRQVAEDRLAVSNRDAFQQANKEVVRWSIQAYHEYLVGHQYISLFGMEVAEISCARGGGGGSSVMMGGGGGSTFGSGSGGWGSVRSSSAVAPLPAMYDGMMVVTRVDIGHAGYTSGLLEDDLLVAVNNKEISGKTSLLNALQVSSNSSFLHEASLPWIRLIVRRGFEGALISIRLTLPR